MSRCIAFLLALALASAVQAQRVEQCFEDPVRQAEYRELIKTIRCMKCQNQSIAESPIDQAADLRRQVCELKQEGQMDNQIRLFLAERYGDFINYQPPVDSRTWLLWAGPGLLLLGGGFVFARILRARMQQPLDEELE